MGGLLIILALTVLLSTAAFLASDRRRKPILLFLSQPHFGRSLVPGARTPPRSLSPDQAHTSEKNEKEQNKADASSTEPDYRTAFPPSIRAELAQVLGDPSLADAPARSRVAVKPMAQEIDEAAAAVAEPVYTPMEVSSEEVARLGDFPDYAALSGVPLPKPWPEFDIQKAQPRPYRPFRWKYHQTMSLTKMEPDWWLELENTYPDRIAQRQKLYAEHGKAVLDSLPGSGLACKELMEMALQFLCARYPHYFRLELAGGLKRFHNGIFHTVTDLAATHPLKVLLDNVPEDFAIVERDERTGYYVFRAGVICSSLGWNLGLKLGMVLADIHKPIPDYKEKMKFSMDRYFSKKPANKPIQRGSWGLEIGTPLYMPPGDPHIAHRSVQHSSLTPDDIFLRVDWQTLRRLPLSGAVVFNFKALFTPLTKMRREPYIPALLLKVLEEGKKELMEYKGTWHVEHVAKPTLAEWKREQEEAGVMEKGWEEHTLEESPYFPGWEKEWRKEQGF